MSDYYVLKAGQNATVDWTSEVILARDNDGNVVKSVGLDQPAQLNKDDLQTLSDLGYEYESSSKSEAEEAAIEAASVGGDVVASAPLIGSPPAAPSGGDKSDSKSTKK